MHGAPEIRTMAAKFARELPLELGHARKAAWHRKLRQ
jgi:hypothetical protein